MKIPDEVFKTYTEGMDLFFEKFGRPCTIVYLKTVSTTSLPSINNKLTQNPFGPTGAKRGNESSIQQEVTEVLTLRVYSDRKTIKKVSGLNVPEASCMTIGPLGFLAKAEKCSYMLVDGKKYERASSPSVWGLDGNYSMCLWNET